MTSSAATTPRAEGRASRVLYVGQDLRLLGERVAVLRAAGFDVVSTTSTDEALAQAGENPFEAVVIGYRISEDDRRLIVDEVRRRSQRAVVILLYRGRIRDAACADAVLSVDSDPKFLVNSLQYQLLEQGRSN